MAESQYVIDEYIGIPPWVLTTGQIFGVSINPGSYKAYEAENTYEISFAPAHTIPINGYVEISFPEDILVPDTSFSPSSCKAP